MKMSECNNGKGEGGGSVKPYIIIKGGFSQPLRPLTEGGRGVQKSEKLPYVIYERPLTLLAKVRSNITYSIPWKVWRSCNIE